MNRNRLFVSMLALLAMLASLPTMQAAAKSQYYFDFNTSLKPWASASDSSSKHILELHMEDNPGDDRPTNNYANLSALADALDGPGAKSDVPLPMGVWTVANVETFGDRYIRLRWNARSTKNCEGCQLMVYVGKAAPTSILQFVNVDDTRYLKAYWQSFSYEADLVQQMDRQQGTANGSESAYVAIGWSGDNASIGLDDITVDVMPQP